MQWPGRRQASQISPIRSLPCGIYAHIACDHDGNAVDLKVRSLRRLIKWPAVWKVLSIEAWVARNL